MYCLFLFFRKQSVKCGEIQPFKNSFCSSSSWLKFGVYKINLVFPLKLWFFPFKILPIVGEGMVATSHSTKIQMNNLNFYGSVGRVVLKINPKPPLLINWLPHDHISFQPLLWDIISYKILSMILSRTLDNAYPWLNNQFCSGIRFSASKESIDGNS